MSKLPQKLNLPMMQTSWAQLIDPVLSNLLIQGNLLKNQSINNGVTVINHGLGRIPQGWFLIAPQGAASVYQDSYQPNPTLTLTLISNAAITSGIWVF